MTKLTAADRRLTANIDFLKRLHKTKNTKRILKKASCTQLGCLIESMHNVNAGNVPLHKYEVKKLKRHLGTIDALSLKNQPELMELLLWNLLPRSYGYQHFVEDAFEDCEFEQLRRMSNAYDLNGGEADYWAQPVEQKYFVPTSPVFPLTYDPHAAVFHPYAKQAPESKEGEALLKARKRESDLRYRQNIKNEDMACRNLIEQLASQQIYEEYWTPFKALLAAQELSKFATLDLRHGQRTTRYQNSVARIVQ
ncbi:unnamed protein product, partial [Mesorhabditis spiculigera]